jgi:hypothetical protein
VALEAARGAGLPDGALAGLVEAHDRAVEAAAEAEAAAVPARPVELRLRTAVLAAERADRAATRARAELAEAQARATAAREGLEAAEALAARRRAAVAALRDEVAGLATAGRGDGGDPPLPGGAPTCWTDVLAYATALAGAAASPAMVEGLRLLREATASERAPSGLDPRPAPMAVEAASGSQPAAAREGDRPPPDRQAPGSGPESGGERGARRGGRQRGAAQRDGSASRSPRLPGDA